MEISQRGNARTRMGSHQTDSNFILKLEQAEDLPVLPQVHSQALRLSQDPDGDLGQLKDILQYDPALTATILKVSNSAFYGFSHKIESLKTALVMLGMGEVTRLIVGAAVVHIFPADKVSSRFDAEIFWRHSAATGSVAAALVNKLKLATQGDVFTGGLLHDLGRVLLATHFPSEYNRCLDFAESNNTTLRLAERQVLGIDHAAIGGYLATRWELPDSLTAMIRYHHSPKKEHIFAVDVASVHLGNRLVKHHGLAIHESDHAETESELWKDPAWEVISGQFWPGEVDVEELTSMAGEEVERADQLISTLLQ